ncbi:MAG: hypothetical protein ACREGI_03945 [Candidatus Levyibacteriota bacterium]
MGRLLEGEPPASSLRAAINKSLDVGIRYFLGNDLGDIHVLDLTSPTTSIGDAQNRCQEVAVLSAYNMSQNYGNLFDTLITLGVPSTTTSPLSQTQHKWHVILLARDVNNPSHWVIGELVSNRKETDGTYLSWEGDLDTVLDGVFRQEGGAWKEQAGYIRTELPRATRPPIPELSKDHGRTHFSILDFDAGAGSPDHKRRSFTIKERQNGAKILLERVSNSSPPDW